MSDDNNFLPKAPFVESLSADGDINPYVETGDPSHLTIELAHKMQVEAEVMRQVAGATIEDIKLAEKREFFLSLYGADDESLSSLSIQQQFRNLLDATTVRVVGDVSIERDDLETIRFDAETKLAAWLLSNEEGMYRLFEVLALDDPQGYHDVLALEQVMSRIKRLYEEDRDPYARAVLEEFMDIAERMKGQRFTSKTLYLPSRYITNYLDRERGEIKSLENTETYVPFELTRGTYATFSSDGRRIFVADKKLSDEIKDAIATGWTKEYRGKEGHSLPSYEYVHIPEDFYFAEEPIIDTGSTLEKYLTTQGVSYAPDIIKDFVSLQRNNFRSVIERDFDFRLPNLTIPEQFHFLSYLKYTTVTAAETMQLFIQNYGIDAMRAFLVNRYDKDASENIMAFGVVIEPDIAKEAFKAYAQFIDDAIQFGTNIKESGVPVETTQMVQEIQESLLRRAGHLFDAGKQMALWEYTGQEQTLDLVDAFNGVAKMQNILARIGHDQTLSVTRNAAREGRRNAITPIESGTFFFDVLDTVTNEKLALKVFIRPQSNADGEARINFELILNDLPENSSLKKGFAQEIEYKSTNKARKDSVIRFGFDLDTKHNPPKFSFDMGRDAYEDETMKRTGDVLGNILKQVAPEGHHLTEFEAKFSDPEVFKKIAESFKTYFEGIT